MQVHQSYWIWFSNRCGSTLLSESLAATGIAGKPGEHLNVDPTQPFRSHFPFEDYESFKQHFWQLAASPNGISGIKYGMHSSHYTYLCEGMSTLMKRPFTQEVELWQDLFPNCKHLYITRRNKVRQAVSWWKAIQDNTWHLWDEQTRQQDAAFYEDKYNFDALSHLFKEASLRECAIEAHLAANGITPMTVVYEDLVRDYAPTLRRILDFLEIDHQEVEIKPPRIKRTADAHSEIWVERFREDLQQGWQAQAW